MLRLALALVALLALSSPASAAGGYLLPGPIFTVGSGPGPGYGVGLEVSTLLWRRPRLADPGWGWGGFGQVEHVGDHWRLAGGLQAGHGFGVELGWSWRGRSDTLAWSTGPQGGVFASTGLFGVGLRGALDLTSGARGRHRGHEVGLVVTVKIPVPVGDPIEAHRVRLP